MREPQPRFWRYVWKLKGGEERGASIWIWNIRNYEVIINTMYLRIKYSFIMNRLFTENNIIQIHSQFVFTMNCILRRHTLILTHFYLPKNRTHIYITSTDAIFKFQKIIKSASILQVIMMSSHL